MQVNSSKGSLQQRVFSGMGSIGGINVPDFNDKYVFSKKKSGISDEEYRKQIVEQAYKDFEKGTFQNKSEGFNRLMKNYTSEVSPDRKGIITSGLKAVLRNRQNVLKPIDFVATLLEGKVKYQKLPSDNSEYIEFYDKNGEMVATYSNNGWTMEELVSLSRDNVTSNAMKNLLENETYDRKIMKKYEETDSNAERKNYVTSYMNAIELARNSKFKEAIKKVEWLYKGQTEPKKEALNM